jgi:hypothetical protein
MHTPILAVDTAGTPRKWVTVETAAIYYARGAVTGEFGRREILLRGGWQRSGARSTLRVNHIVALRGPAFVPAAFQRVPALTNAKLFARDRNVCAYGGDRFRDRDLSRDHIVPVARGGRDTWMNVVTACRACNRLKGERLPEECGRRLIYLPYVPSLWEDFILANRNLLADQMEYLLSSVPAHSRLKN